MDRRIEKILQVLKDEPTRRVRVKDLAQFTGLSVSRTQHVFRRETGVAFGQYLKAMRMEKARQLLETSFLSVKEIMAKLGENDQSHFGRNYKTKYGASPGKYRSNLPSRKPQKRRATKSLITK